MVKEVKLIRLYESYIEGNPELQVTGSSNLTHVASDSIDSHGSYGNIPDVGGSE